MAKISIERGFEEGFTIPEQNQQPPFHVTLEMVNEH